MVEYKILKLRSGEELISIVNQVGQQETFLPKKTVKKNPLRNWSKALRSKTRMMKLSLSKIMIMRNSTRTKRIKTT